MKANRLGQPRRKRLARKQKWFLDPTRALPVVIAVSLTVLLLVMAVGAGHEDVPDVNQSENETESNKPAKKASKTTYDAFLTGEGAIPSNKSKAIGTVAFTLVGSKLTFTVAAAGLEGGAITGIHIHDEATRDSNGNVVKGGAIIYVLGSISPAVCVVTNGASVCSSSGSLTLNISKYKDKLDEGQLYVNVHTEKFPNGEISGNLTAALSEDTSDDSTDGDVDENSGESNTNGQ